MFDRYKEEEEREEKRRNTIGGEEKQMREIGDRADLREEGKNMKLQSETNKKK